MNYYIVTGASKGLGESIINQLLLEGNVIVGLSRTVNESLMERANQLGINLIWHSVHLGVTKNVENVINDIFKNFDYTKINSITLINNAGVIEPITTVGKMESNDIAMNVETNLLAPIVLTNLFIKHTETFEGAKRVVNVSSGAANKPNSGWSVYCSTKAGLDMFTKTVGLEQVNALNPATVISFSPGVMDTSMQTTIRSKTKDEFDTVERFLEYKNQGMLRTTDFVSSVLINLLNSSDLENGRVYDIKQLI